MDWGWDNLISDWLVACALHSVRECDFCECWGMPTVWQSLIPETPSTEPISIIGEDLESHRDRNCRDSSANYYETHQARNNFLSPPLLSKQRKTSGGSGSSSKNNNGTSTAHYHHHHPYSENNGQIHPSGGVRGGGNGTESSTKTRAFHRLASSLTCGEQFWRWDQKFQLIMTSTGMHLSYTSVKTHL
jgi:hypothetical protein